MNFENILEISFAKLEKWDQVFYENDLHTVQKIYLMNQLTTSIA